MDRPVSDLTGLLVQWPFETGPETTAGSVMAPSKRDGRDQAVWALRITAEIGSRIDAGVGANLWILQWNAPPIALRGAGAV